jgi:photosystem II stability/assembly factor-like uncharacterized protein
MRHSLTGSAAVTGLTAVLALACSDASSPTADSRAPTSLASATSPPSLTEQHSGTLNRLQAVSPVSRQIVWASGVGGTYAVTRDGGETWHAAVVPGAEALQFRDVEGVSGQEAYLLAAGTGKDSRIYHTVNGGQTWELQFKNRDPLGFFDCFAFWSPDRGIVMADPVEGRFPVRRTTSGRLWNDIGDNLPAAQPGEFAFAASGTCAATQGQDRAWLATGGAEKARILATTDGGDTWRAFNTPIIQGTPGSGVFTVAFRDALHGILAGGDLERLERTKNVAVSSDGGKTWTLAANAPFQGAVFGLSYAAGHDRAPLHKVVVITGPGGAAWSPDEGQTWTRLRGVRDFWAVAFANQQDGWLVGTEGRILKITF